jgi:hypothetical protein
MEFFMYLRIFLLDKERKENEKAIKGDYMVNKYLIHRIKEYLPL